MRIIRIIKKYMIFFVAVIFAFLCLVFSGKVKTGIEKGIGICTQTVVPALFPMMILSSFLVYTGIPLFIRKLIFFPYKIITGLNDQTAEIFIFGTLAGYPVGVKTASSVYKSRNISLDEVKKAALVNVNPGLAFSVIAVGKQYFGSAIIGITLFVSVTLGNLLLGLILRNNQKKTGSIINKEPDTIQPAEALINAVNVSVRNTVSVCAWILLFSAVNSLFENADNNSFILYFTEVTSAALLCAEEKRYAVCAFCLGFGGFCILFQLLTDLRMLKIGVVKYLFCRAFCGIAAYLVETVIIRILPGTVLTAVYGEVIFVPATSTCFATASLALLCVVFMISLQGNGKRNKNILAILGK